MQVEFLKSTVTDETGSNGRPYKRAVIGYKVDGKPRTIGVLSFQTDVFNVVTQAKEGDILEVEFAKNQKGYWELKSAKETGNSAEAGQVVGSGKAVSKPAASGGQWETREERAQRQVYIVRQSSLDRAVDVLKARGNLKLETKDIKNLADEFVSYVMNTDPVKDL